MGESLFSFSIYLEENTISFTSLGSGLLLGARRGPSIGETVSISINCSRFGSSTKSKTRHEISHFAINQRRAVNYHNLKTIVNDDFAVRLQLNRPVIDTKVTLSYFMVPV